jgi:hypothetical protein
VVNDGIADSDPDSVTITVEDTQPPVLDLPTNLTKECEGNLEAYVSVVATCNDACGDVICENDRAGANCDASGYYPMGETVVTFTCTDEVGRSVTKSSIVSVVDSTLPDFTVPADIITECTGMDGTPVDIGMASGLDVCCGDVTISNNAPTLFPLGENIVTWTATDCNSLSTSKMQTVTIVDTTPPEISSSLDPIELWPPNHRMVDVNATVVATDICSIPMVTLFSVESDEPDNAQGAGDGNTTNDIQEAEVGTEDYEYKLRAERNGSGDGRDYIAIYKATDPSGNETAASSISHVPHDKGGETDPVNTDAEESTNGTLLTWSNVEDAQHYNVCRGTLSNINETESIIDLGPVKCIEVRSLDRTTHGWEDLEMPEPGEAFFYLVEYDNGMRSSYGTESALKPRVPNSGDCK